MPDLMGCGKDFRHYSSDHEEPWGVLVEGEGW